MKKLIVLVAFVLVAMFALPSVSFAAEVIIGVDYATSDKYNLQIYDAVREEGAERGWMVFGAEGQREPEGTLANIDSFITRGANYVLTVGVDTNLQAAVQEKCEAAGVVSVFTAGSRDPGYTIVTDSGSTYEVTKQVAAFLAQQVKEQWNGQVDLAVVTTNLAMGEVGQDIITACSEVWSAELGVSRDDLYIVDCPWDNLRASELFTSMLTANPEARHILAYSFVDLHHGVPLYNAAKAAGRLDQLIMGGQNTADDSTPIFMQESPKTWVVQAPLGGDVPGRLFINLIVGALDGIAIEKKEYSPTDPSPLSTPDDIADYY